MTVGDGVVDVGSAPREAGLARTDEAIRRRIAHYFDHMQVFYSRCWSRHGVHYGHWEPGTRRHSEAIRNADRLVARELALPAGSRVLDAGCGVGGTSVFLAEEHGLEMVGITLSEDQLRRARSIVAEGRGRAPTLLRADYVCTGFPGESFDGVFGLESICYAEPKRAFLQEAFRLLRPGGRLVVVDGFLAKSLDRGEAEDYRRFMDGVALTGLAPVNDFAADLSAVGFEEVRWADRTRQVMRSALMIGVMTSVGVGLGWALFRLGLLPRLWLNHGLAGISQRRLFRTRAIVYGAFTATKPARRS